MFRRVTAPLSWDDLDAQSCLQEGAVPDWSSLIVVGPIKRRDEHGHMTLEWEVTVHCRPGDRQGAGSGAGTGALAGAAPDLSAVFVTGPGGSHGPERPHAAQVRGRGEDPAAVTGA